MSLFVFGTIVTMLNPPDEFRFYSCDYKHAKVVNYNFQNSVKGYNYELEVRCKDRTMRSLGVSGFELKKNEIRKGE